MFLAVDYSDSDGEEQGGTLRTRATFQPSGISSVLDFGLPSTRAQITGTTEGTITVQGCISFGPATGATMEVALLHKGGHFSNVLSSDLNRPAGAPEARRGDEARWGTEERLHQ